MDCDGTPPARRLVADLGRVIGTLHGHAAGFRAVNIL